jgi:Leucine-rich repeat (LRR) protein
VVSLACASATGFAFDLECSETEKWANTHDELCIVDNLNGLKITERGAVMSPSQFDDVNKITWLVIRNQTVHYIPKFTVKLAKRLTFLVISRCGLKEVRKEDLKQFPQLKTLALDKNDLEWLEGDLFVFNPVLELVMFSLSRKLKYIGENLLDSLPKLENAWFDHAGCINDFTISSRELKAFKTKLKSECKDEPTRLKMLAE